MAEPRKPVMASRWSFCSGAQQYRIRGSCRGFGLWFHEHLGVVNPFISIVYGKFQDRRNRMKEKKIKKVIRALALIPLLCMAIALPIAAQSTSGSMAGSVL